MKIKLLENQNIFFSSDLHFGQANICKGISQWTSGGHRDFNTIEEMNNVIVFNLNNIIKEDDIFICLGDWSFGGFDNILKLRSLINCKNVILFLGNHDHHIKKNKDNIRDYFTNVLECEDLKIKTFDDKSYNFFCCHYPLSTWPEIKDGAIHLHGHLHSSNELKLHKNSKSMDVGLDGNNLMPYSLNDILKIMEHQKIGNLILQKDHHLNN